MKKRNRRKMRCDRMETPHPVITYVVQWRTEIEGWRDFGPRTTDRAEALAEFEAACRNPRCTAARILRCRETYTVLEEMEREDT